MSNLAHVTIPTLTFSCTVGTTSSFHVAVSLVRVLCAVTLSPIGWREAELAPGRLTGIAGACRPICHIQKYTTKLVTITNTIMCDIYKLLRDIVIVSQTRQKVLH